MGFDGTESVVAVARPNCKARYSNVSCPRSIRKLMAPDCRMLCDGNAGLKMRYDLRQSASDASGDVPVHYRDGGVRHQRAAGAEARVPPGGGSRTSGGLHRDHRPETHSVYRRAAAVSYTHLT